MININRMNNHQTFIISFRESMWKSDLDRLLESPLPRESGNYLDSFTLSIYTGWVQLKQM